MADSRRSQADAPPGLYTRALTAWVEWVTEHPRRVLLAVALVSVAALAYTSEHFAIDSDNGKLVRKDAPFREYYEEFDRAFPHYDESTLIVLSAATRPRARDAAQLLAERLRASPELFRNIFVPSEGEFFDNNGLLYLERPELEDMVERLSEAQPALAALAEDPSLRGLSGQLVDALEAARDGEGLPSGFVRISDRVSQIAEGLSDGRLVEISWEDEFLADEPGDEYGLIALQGVKTFGESAPSELQIDTIRQAAVDLGLVPERGIRVRLTGMVPLEHEEISGMLSNIGTAAAISVLILLGVVIFGLRSLRVVIAITLSVAVGIAWTFAFGLLAVGQFNTISMAFSVLLIGLGVDFSLHLALRYQENLKRGDSSITATRRASAGVGTAVSLCALTSSIGFLAFVPTEYTGIGQLGIVMAGGLFLSLLATFVVVPAVLAISGTPRGHGPELAVPRPVIGFLERNAVAVAAGSAILALLAGLISTQMSFDFSTLGTKDPESESMTTLAELHEEGILTDYAVTVLAPDWQAVASLAERLRSLSTVAEVRTPEYHLPDEQDDKLFTLEDAQDFMWPVLRRPERLPMPSWQQRSEALLSLTDALETLEASQVDPEAFAAAKRLAAALTPLLARSTPESLERLEVLVLADFDEQLDWLSRVLQARHVEFSDLPEPLRRRLVSDDGKVVISVFPKEDVRDVDNLRTFVEQVASVAPRATGRPVVEAGIGAIVVRSFRQALVITAICVLLVLAVALRDPTETLLVLAPIVMAALLTVASGVLLGLRFNMVNVVLIPLVFGLGVDNGIHIVMRHRDGQGIEEVLRSSTPRAILLSGLTTLGAFGALSVSDHAGISSLGVLLSLAMIYLFFCTLLVLPALLWWRSQRQSKPQSSRAELQPELLDEKN